MTEAIPLRFGHSLDFGKLLERASRRNHVAQGLALAYGGFMPSLRRALLEEIEQKAKGLGISLFPVLCQLLAVETDVDIAREIAKKLASARTQRRASANRAWLRVGHGDNDTGAALLGFARHDECFEVYAFSWDAVGLTDVKHHAKVNPSKLSVLLEAFLARSHAMHADSASPEAVLDHVCEVLWRRREETGTFRPVLASFARELRL